MISKKNANPKFSEIDLTNKQLTKTYTCDGVIQPKPSGNQESNGEQKSISLGPLGDSSGENNVDIIKIKNMLHQ